MGEGAQRGQQSFFLDETTRLEESPFSAGVRAWFVRELRQRNAGAVQPDLAGCAAERDQCFHQRARAGQHEVRPVAHLLQGGAVRTLVQPDEHIGTVERNDDRLAARAAQKREKLHGDVPEKDVQQCTLPLCQTLGEHGGFRAGEINRPTKNLLVD